MAPTSPVKAVQLGTLIKVMKSLHGVPDARLPALKGRFANFSKLGLPDVTAVGTGSRAEYWPTHVAQLLLAFELLRFRIPQTAAAHGIKASLATIDMAFGSAARRIVSGKAGKAPVLLAVSSNALVEDAKHPQFLDMAIEPAGPTIDGRGDAAALTINAATLMENAVRAARHTDEPFEASFFTRLGSS